MATIYGTAGKDNLRGTRKADAIYGLQDDDLIRGGQGRDFLYGGLNSDTLDGGVGHDVLFGDGGRDWLLGGWGNDVLFGGGGNDWLSDGGGADSVYGGIGDDVLAAWSDDNDADRFDGGAGVDTIDVSTNYSAVIRANLLTGTLRVGDAARDSLVSIENIIVRAPGAAAAIVNGSPADNLIQLGNGDNIVYAGMGNDTILGGAIVSEGGRELLNGGGGNDMIDAFTSSTTVPEPATGFADQTLVGGAGDDTLSAGVSYVTMSGGSGEDEFWFTGSGAAHNAPQATITDYEAGETLRVINIPGLIFAGETDAPGLMEFGYHREGSDTVIEANTGPDTSEPLNIRLIGYTGPITADDFILS